jgi:hypothetical protein
MPMNTNPWKGESADLKSAVQDASTLVSVGQYIARADDDLYIPNTPIGFTITGFKPNTRASIFFDSVNVTTNCAPAAYDTTLTTVKASDYFAQNTIGSPLVSDSTGTLKGIFYLQKNAFKVGKRQFAAFNYTSSNDTYANSSASYTCSAYSYFNAFNSSPSSPKNPALISTIPNDHDADDTITARGSGTSTLANPNSPSFNPLAQTFYVGADAALGQDGVHVVSLDLYFASVSSTQPVTIDIRTVSNGIPTTSIVPYSSVTLPATSVNISTSTAPNPTTFKFATPIYLRSGYSYAICVTPGGQVPDYTLWYGVSGHTDPYLASPCNQNWGQGVLYGPSSGSTWTPKNNASLKFTLRKQTGFVPTGTVTLTNKDYEFLTYASISNASLFIPGEYVYQQPVPLPGAVSVSTTSNTISFVTTGTVTTNLATSFAVNDHILVVGSLPSNPPLRSLNYGIFSNVFSVKVTSVNPSNNSLTFVHANGYTGNAPWSNTSAVFFKPAPGIVTMSSGSNIVVGVGTAFNRYSNTYKEGFGYNPLVVQHATGYEVLLPSNIANNNQIATRNVPSTSTTYGIPLSAPVGKVVATDPNRNLIILDMSSANGSSSNTAWQNVYNNVSYFAPNRVLVGTQSGTTALISGVVDISMNSVQPYIYQTTPGQTRIGFSANTTTNQYVDVDYPNISVSGTTKFRDNQLVIMSKTNEINNYGGNKSLKFNATLSTTNSAITPSIDINHIGAIARSYIIGPSSTNEYSPSQGTALSKSISKIVTLAPGLDAEDLNVYLTAYKPPSTDIQVYAKLLNSSDTDQFANKKWTKLVQVTSSGVVSDITNTQDYKEYQYTIPYAPTTVPVLSELATTNNSNVVISTDGTSKWSSEYSNGQLITIYNDIGLLNYGVYQIATVNNTYMTLYSNVSTTNSTSAVLASMPYPEAAFKNTMNNNIVRYHNVNGVAYDSYIQYAIKIVFLSSNPNVIPKVSNMRALALSV